MLFYRTFKITIRPKFSAPQLLFYLWTSPENFFGCKTFYDRYYLIDPYGLQHRFSQMCYRNPKTLADAPQRKREPKGQSLEGG